MHSVFRSGLFEGKVAIVTGGGTGIGKAIARELIYLGSKVVISSRKEEKLLKAAVELSRYIQPSSSAEVKVIPCNIREEQQVILWNILSSLNISVKPTFSVILKDELIAYTIFSLFTTLLLMSCHWFSVGPCLQLFVITGNWSFIPGPWREELLPWDKIAYSGHSESRAWAEKLVGHGRKIAHLAPYHLNAWISRLQ